MYPVGLEPTTGRLLTRHMLCLTELRVQIIIKRVLKNIVW